MFDASLDGGHTKVRSGPKILQPDVAATVRILSGEVFSFIGASRMKIVIKNNPHQQTVIHHFRFGFGSWIHYRISLNCKPEISGLQRSGGALSSGQESRASPCQ